jgi:hypothetical protein
LDLTEGAVEMTADFELTATSVFFLKEWERKARLSQFNDLTRGTIQHGGTHDLRDVTS